MRMRSKSAKKCPRIPRDRVRRNVNKLKNEKYNFSLGFYLFMYTFNSQVYSAKDKKSLNDTGVCSSN